MYETVLLVRFLGKSLTIIYPYLATIYVPSRIILDLSSEIKQFIKEVVLIAFKEPGIETYHDIFSIKKYKILLKKKMVMSNQKGQDRIVNTKLPMLNKYG